MSKVSNKRHQQKRRKMWAEIELKNSFNPYSGTGRKAWETSGKSVEQRYVESLERHSDTIK